jgi:hypothetical protein
MSTCQIIDYEGDEMYQPIKINGKWEDQSGQQIRKNYKNKKINCPCKQYLNEFCNGTFKSNLIYTTENHTYFITIHRKSKGHVKWLEHKNSITSSLEEKSKNELIERIEELQRNMRKDKVDHRGYLELQEKRHEEALLKLEEKNKDLIEKLQDKTYIISNLGKEIRDLKIKSGDINFIDL